MYNICISTKNGFAYMEIEPRHVKSGNLHMRNQRQRSAADWQLIHVFVFATWLVRSLFYLNSKFQASSNLLWLFRRVCVGPGQKHRSSAGPKGGLRGTCPPPPPKRPKVPLKTTIFFSCTAERKGWGGGTDRAVTPACK